MPESARGRIDSGTGDYRESQVSRLASCFCSLPTAAEYFGTRPFLFVRHFRTSFDVGFSSAHAKSLPLKFFSVIALRLTRLSMR